VFHCQCSNSRIAYAEPVWEPEGVTATLLAHQGGWDEVLMVLVPIVLFGLLPVVANKRAGAIEEQRERDDADDRPEAGDWRRGRPGPSR
jgi:hypothetical protein